MLKKFFVTVLLTFGLLLTSCASDAQEKPNGLVQIPAGGAGEQLSGGEGSGTPSTENGNETAPGGEESTPTEGEVTPPAGDEPQGDTTPEVPDGGGESEPPEEEQPQEPARKLRLLSVTTPIKRGNKATVEVCGRAGVEYDIVVLYSSGESGATGLENKKADAEGYVSWTWRVGGGTKPGTYTIRVIGGDEELEISFTVTEK